MSPLSIVIAIMGLALLIVLHEGGHFLVARLSGMRVDRFSIGFGPPLARFTRHRTIFQSSAIPLGDFVQIAGLTPGEATEQTTVERDGRLEQVERRLDDPQLYPN